MTNVNIVLDLDYGCRFVPSFWRKPAILTVGEDASLRHRLVLSIVCMVFSTPPRFLQVAQVDRLLGTARFIKYREKEGG